MGGFLKPYSSYLPTEGEKSAFVMQAEFERCCAAHGLVDPAAKAGAANGQGVFIAATRTSGLSESCSCDTTGDLRPREREGHL
jgi:hypothetical protein